ncbi:aldo/keto reductase [Salimicrobium flavidum]|uniref:Aldo/keto reductase n=1 Tax=Salimicrobium flavidum TaxID=570947 RepID=A0A1N7KR49_9BACI|nr:aldo/keto reductase [Salimicrobium flavidum]SIS64045.1 Aldo/keto reductase [Salimicrobium flavidum]
MDYVELRTNIKMPQLGFGVWQVDKEDTKSAIIKALKTGYRSIDTAAIYGNESEVGHAVTSSGVPRNELFITTKVWNSDQGYENTRKAFNESLSKLGLDYVDLYLIHWPTPEYDEYIETYKAMERLQQEGKVRAIGVCNFDIEHLQRLMDECDVKPAINQVECHPYLAQIELTEFCKENGILMEAWSPLMQGGEVLKDPIVQRIAAQHEKTGAQVIIRWHLQNNRVVIPKSTTPARIEENFNVFDFELTKDDMKKLNGLDRGQRKGRKPSEMNIR